MGGKASGQVAGYKYLLSMLMGIGRGPLDGVTQIKVGGMVAWTGPVYGTNADITGTNPTDYGGGSIPINQPQLFGGDTAEGGIVGTMDIWMGAPDQVLRPAIKSIISSTNEVPVATTDGSTSIAFPPVDQDADPTTTDKAPTTGNPNIPIGYVLLPVAVPEMRGTANIWYDGAVCSNNPYPKEWKVRAFRILAGWDGDPWYPERANIDLVDTTALSVAATDAGTITHTGAGSGDGSGDTTNTTPATTALLLPENGVIHAMNGAHIIYECITNRDWGRGLDRIMIDDDSFTSAANQLYTEGFGICLKWSKTDDLGTFIQTVIDHVGATLYTDRQTGLLTLKLIRADYNVADLPVFDYASGLLSIEESANAAFDTLTNQIVVKYHSPVSDTDRQVRAQSIASIQAIGAVYSEEKEYPGIPTPDLAMRIAQRDLASVAWGVKSYELKMDRRAYKLAPGGVFVLNAPDRNILSSILRCLTIEDSTQTDGTIKITAAQDVFGLPLTTFGQVQASQWNPPNKNPQVVSYHRIRESTYRDAYLKLPAAVFNDLTTDQTGVVDLVVAPSSLSTSFLLNTSVDATNYSAYGPKGFTTYGQLVNAITRFQLTMVIAGLPSDTTFKLPLCVLVDDEFIRIDSLDLQTGIAAIARGCIDSVPIDHAAGAVVWFYDTGSSDNQEYIVGETVTLFEQPRTSQGILTAASAPRSSITLIGRMGRPYCPCNVTVNGPYSLPGYIVTAKDLTINWSRRNRISTQDFLNGYDTGDQIPETGQLTTVRIRRLSDNVVINQFDNLAGTTFVYDQLTAIRDGAFGLIQIETYAVTASGLTSMYADLYQVTYYPAATAGAIGHGAFKLSGSGSARQTISGTMTATFRFMELAELGDIGLTASVGGSFALRATQYGTTVGGFYSNVAIVLRGTMTGTIPAIGTSTGAIHLTAKQGDNTALMTQTATLKITSPVQTGIPEPGYGSRYGRAYGA